MNESLKTLLPIVLLICLYALVFLYGNLINIPKQAKKKKAILSEYEAVLSSTGFNITKRMTLLDFLTERQQLDSNFSKNCTLGLWVDYPAKKLALRTSIDEVAPKVFSHDDLVDYELMEGTKSKLKFTAVGYGPFASISGREREYVKNLSIRVVFGGASGVNSFSIPIFTESFINKITIGGKAQVKDKSYQNALEYVQSVFDELGNIMRLNQQKQST